MDPGWALVIIFAILLLLLTVGSAVHTVPEGHKGTVHRLLKSATPVCGAGT
jgi:hypothetical protein